MKREGTQLRRKDAFTKITEEIDKILESTEVDREIVITRLRQLERPSRTISIDRSANK